MLKISLSKLEEARKNPAFFAQSLINEQTNRGGRQGFASTFKSVTRDFHEKDRDFDYSLQALEDKLALSFNDTVSNRRKRKAFCESFQEYQKLFKAKALVVDCFHLNISWQLISQAKLTGHSPFLCSSEDLNIAYFFVERVGNWLQDLKYPLLQIYLAENFYKCEVGKLQIGVYAIQDKIFDLKTFEDFELDNALHEGKNVLRSVADVYGGYFN